MHSDYGAGRVLEPAHVLPVSAWKLDNSREIGPDEMRIDVRRIHIENTSFKEICLEAGTNDQRIKQKIMDIVIRRGKLHNPVTDTGGMLYGTVSEVGSEYRNTKGLKPGDEVLCIASLSCVPLFIDRIISVNKAYGQIDVEGYAIVPRDMPVSRRPIDLPLPLLMFTLNESGTIYRISTSAVGKKKFLVVGNNLLSNILCGYAIKKVAVDDAEIVCVLDHKTDTVLRGQSINKLMSEIFSAVHYVDILKPLEFVDTIGEDGLFDLSVNCAEINGAETINILATRSGGTVIFANLISNYNIALYITEAISRQLDIRCADGYLEAYDDFDFEIVRDLAPYIEQAEETAAPVKDDLSQPYGQRNAYLMDSGTRKTMMEDIVCESHAMASVMNEVLTISKYDCNVMITGETGSGKEKIANVIHKNSSRNLMPFIKVNCASISPGLLEDEFFGSEETAADGTVEKVKKGYFELADNGTIFLDEISGLGLDMQARILRVIQDGEFFRVGGTVPVKTNIRVLSATNKNIQDMIDAGTFRRDLFYRLNVFHIRMPALRERTSDVAPLVEHFLNAYGNKFGIRRTMSRDAVDYLAQCEWKGNIRELENVVQRLMIGSKRDEITLLDVMRDVNSDVFDINAFSAQSEASDGEVVSMDTMVENFEKNIIRHALDKYGSTRKAAKAIGISQTQLVRKKNKYGI